MSDLLHPGPRGGADEPSHSNGNGNHRPKEAIGGTASWTPGVGVSSSGRQAGPDRQVLMEPTGPAELELRDYLQILNRRKLIVFVVAAVVTAGALCASLLQTPVYEATTEVLLQQRTSERIFSPQEQGVARPADAVQTEIEVMGSRSVRDAVAEELGDEPEVSITARGETEVVVIRAENSEPAAAAIVTDTYAETFIEIRRQQLVDDLLGAASQVQARIDALDLELQEGDERVAAVDAAIANASSENERELLRVERDGLLAELANARVPLLSQRTSYAQQLDELQLSSSITRSGGARIVSAAEVSDSPIRPTPLRNAMIGGLIGLLLGVGLAFLREHLDDTITSKEDLERATGGLVSLALVPTVAGWKEKKQTFVVSQADPKSPAAEAYRSLRTSVQFIGLDRPLRSLQFTSANAGDGKSTTIANLAIALGRTGQRVVIVCCDLRRPRIHEFFGLPNQVGLTSVLLGEVSVANALQGIDGEPNVVVLSSGPPPPNPSEVLSSPRVADVFARLTAQCDIVLVDSSPILPVTDGLIVSNLVDGTVLVASARVSTRHGASRAVELLRQVDAALLGTVLNKVTAEDLYGYGTYGYPSVRSDLSNPKLVS